MSRPAILVTRRLPPEVEARLGERFDASLNPDDTPPGPTALRRALSRYDGILCTVTDRIDAELLSVEPLRARILANFGVGYEHIDVDAARARGIIVTNTPGVLTAATADLAIMLMLMAARRAGEGERELRDGRWAGWRPTHMIGRPVAGRTLGIIGMGRIGSAVAHRASRGFAMRVLYCTRSAPRDAPAGAESVTLDALLQSSDVVSIHCPATPETRRLIDDDRLRRMRPHAVLVNTARGEIVDEAALAAALRDGVIGAAGLDVYEREPAVHPDLLRLENVVLLPHLGSATTEARVAMGLRAVENLRAYFAGEAVSDPVPAR